MASKARDSPGPGAGVRVWVEMWVWSWTSVISQVNDEDEKSPDRVPRKAILEEIQEAWRKLSASANIIQSASEWNYYNFETMEPGNKALS